MSEWWTYRPSDFLMFSPRTYHRLFELMNAAWWPLPWLLPLAGLVLVALAFTRHARLAGWAWAAVWAFVGWAFHAERYAQVMTAAPWFAGAFCAQALLLVLVPVLVRPVAAQPSITAWGLWGLAFVAWPLSALAEGRPPAQVQVFGLAPDPTALATLGLLAAMRPSPWWLWPLPLLWCAASALTLATMDEVLPAAALVAATGAALVSRSRSRPRSS